MRLKLINADLFFTCSSFVVHCRRYELGKVLAPAGLRLGAGARGRFVAVVLLSGAVCAILHIAQRYVNRWGAVAPG